MNNGVPSVASDSLLFRIAETEACTLQLDTTLHRLQLDCQPDSTASGLSRALEDYVQTVCHAL